MPGSLTDSGTSPLPILDELHVVVIIPGDMSPTTGFFRQACAATLLRVNLPVAQLCVAPPASSRVNSLKELSTNCRNIPIEVCVWEGRGGEGRGGEGRGGEGSMTYNTL